MAPMEREAPPTAHVALGAFMQARIQRQDEVVLSMLTDDYRMSGEVAPNLLQGSNPCWYRYEVLAMPQVEPGSSEARVRLYSHNWGGDLLGGLPESWVENIDLLDTGGGWKIDRVGPPEDKVEEPAEPHGPTVSACTTARS
jgi:hypothetical protein